MGKRENGYHDLDTLFYPLSIPFDILEIEEVKEWKDCEKTDTKDVWGQETAGREASETEVKKKADEEIGKKTVGETEISETEACDAPLVSYGFKNNIRVQCETDGIDLENNTLTKAYGVYAAETGFSPKIHINLEKGIPHGAGLGGGSSDAAALLGYLQQKNPHPLSECELINIAAKVGADVPFFLINTPCKATGIGEILYPVSLDLDELYLVLITPYTKINTKWAFLKLDEEKKDLTVFDSLRKSQRSSSGKDFFWENDFENPVFSMYPHLGAIKKELIKQGASVALLSGSGSSIFGLFRSLENAKNAEKIFKIMFDEDNEGRVYTPIEIR